MVIQLYMVPASPPVRAVQMTAKALGIELELKQIDILKGDNRTPEFLKLNPQHTVPVINDNGTILWDSHAINAYLVSKYGKTDTLYPKDLVKRAIIDQRLHFDTGILFATLTGVVRTVFYKNKKTLEQYQIDGFHEGYDFLEKFLEGRKWMTGDTVTLADYSIYTTLGTTSLAVPVNPTKFPKLAAWYKNVDALPESEVAKEGLKIAHEAFANAMG